MGIHTLSFDRFRILDSEISSSSFKHFQSRLTARRIFSGDAIEMRPFNRVSLINQLFEKVELLLLKSILENRERPPG